MVDPRTPPASGGSFTPGAVVRLLGGLAAALAHVHRRGHVHTQAPFRGCGLGCTGYGDALDLFVSGGRGCTCVVWR